MRYLVLLAGSWRTPSPATVLGIATFTSALLRPSPLGSLYLVLPPSPPLSDGLFKSPTASRKKAYIALRYLVLLAGSWRTPSPAAVLGIATFTSALRRPSPLGSLYLVLPPSPPPSDGLFKSPTTSRKKAYIALRYLVLLAGSWRTPPAALLGIAPSPPPSDGHLPLGLFIWYCRLLLHPLTVISPCRLLAGSWSTPTPAAVLDFLILASPPPPFNGPFRRPPPCDTPHPPPLVVAHLPRPPAPAVVLRLLLPLPTSPPLPFLGPPPSSWVFHFPNSASFL